MKPLQVAVVGHTNTGKTSLLRTLTRDRAFGDVSDRPAVTRHVEGRSLLVGGQPVAELYDTPGLEDSIGLLDHLQTLRGDRRADGLEVVRRFLDGDEARGAFEQEAKALRQVLACDVALYVVDARERVLGKHRDELEILAWCARPVVPVLNFVASPDARSAEWREHLSRANMHAVAEFDTVVLDAEGETRLYEKMRTLLDAHRDVLTRLIEDRRAQRSSLVRAAAGVVADLLIDAAAVMLSVPARDRAAMEAAIERLKTGVRAREERAVATLLELFRFTPEDLERSDLPFEGGTWGADLFSPEALREVGLRATSGAAAGATIGLGLDVALAGLSLGTGAAAGAAIGALWGTIGRQGRRWVDLARGHTELRCEDATVKLLLAREAALVRALVARGHASVKPVQLSVDAAELVKAPLPPALRLARAHPEWSRIDRPSAGGPRRQAAHDELARTLEEHLRRP